MENRFFEMSDYLDQVACPDDKKKSYEDTNGKGGSTFNGLAASQSFSWSKPMSVTNRVLVVLMENGGVDLGIPELINKLLSALNISIIPDSVKDTLVSYVRDKIKGFTDNLIETAELTINRYGAARPDLFGNVIVLRNGTATYQELKDTLVRLSHEQKIIDVFILTHGGTDSIALSGGVDINGDKIRDIKTANGGPLSIRSVYMMNCVGASLNKAWMESGAKVSSGSIRNNYLPEPTMYFFWNNWKAGQNFETAVTGAYRKTINLMNDAVRAALSKIPFVSSYASSVNFENFDFVKDSAPVIQGQRSLTITSDELTFSQSFYNSLATTVLPVDVLESLSQSRSVSTGTASRPWSLSADGIALIKKFEGFRAKPYNDPVGHCTVGYGTLIHTGSCNGGPSEQPYQAGISEQDATKLLLEKAKQFERTINDAVKVNLTQGQVDSLISFTYNVGSGNFTRSTLLRMLNEGDYNAVPGELDKWVWGRVNGQKAKLPGLEIRRKAEAAMFSGNSVGVAQSLSEYSRPFYDTGEHAIFGEFINNAVSGPLASVVALQPTTTFSINGVPFTYGQIITMGDFYDRYEDFAAASAAELNRLKVLVTKSENHYKNSILGIGSPVGDVGTAEWKSPTVGIGQRYLDLALKNNSHFSPPPAGTATSTANNKQSWELYHAKAIQKARSGAGLNAAYPINAFADHFLTDAFSAGHLVNKELVMKKFIANVMSGSSVNSAGDKMFEQIADGALAVPSIRAKLAKYEVTETHWYVAGKHFNLDVETPKIFYRVLKGIMEDTASGGQQQIANLAVKAIHDFLNEYQAGGKKGVPVKNNKGTAWNLAGDGTLSWDSTNHVNNLEIIQGAVKQSVENIDDALKNPSTPIATYYQRVWDNVPVLTDPATRAIVDNAINTFTNPASSQLVQKAVHLIDGEIDTLLDALLNAKKIRSVNTSWWG